MEERADSERGTPASSGFSDESNDGKQAGESVTANSTPDRIRRRQSHNPSPPPELLAAGSTASGDAIGDTLFSERWVLQTLMKLTEVVGDKSLGIATDNDDDDFVEELNEEVETILCQLWDMSANKDVVRFLLGLPTLDLIADAMTRTKIPRLTEIVAGIVANIACVEEGCQKLSEHDKLKSVALQLLDVSDPPTLTELFRFLLTCTRSKDHSSTWLNLYREDNHFLPHLTFIMASSTNSQLLTMAGKFLDHVLDSGNDFCSDWASNIFVDSLLEAVRQVGVKNTETVETYLHILQLLSTSAKGKEALVQHSNAAVKVVSRYVAYLCDEDCFHIVGRESGLASAIRLMHILLLASAKDTISLFGRDKTLRSVTKLTTAFRQTSGNEDVLHKSVVVCDNSEAPIEIESSLLRKLLEEAVVTLIEDVLTVDKGIDMLLSELNEQDEKISRAFLIWIKTFTVCHNCYGRLKDAIASGATRYKRLFDAIEKVDGGAVTVASVSESVEDEG